MLLHGCNQYIHPGSNSSQSQLLRIFTYRSSRSRRRIAQYACAHNKAMHRAMMKLCSACLTALVLTVPPSSISPMFVASASTVAQVTPSGVIPIDAEDEDSVLSNLLNEAMSYISGVPHAPSSIKFIASEVERERHSLACNLSKCRFLPGRWTHEHATTREWR